MILRPIREEQNNDAKKLLIGSITGLLVVGGAIGAGAASKNQDVSSKGEPTDLISTGEAEEIAIKESGGKVKRYRA
ncbi:hypothetical protein [Siminovitchia terrae]|uniref:hypothetical protein n=1 Tax=Siminovitchia terrae TaxID=1914933 RepID=UPI0028AE5863|nr:hypothetical protein [Siminovitchia terrae]